MVGVVDLRRRLAARRPGQSEGLLLGARGLQGLGAAIASPAALALITTTFPAGPQRNRAFSVYAAMSGAGAAVGLILGGWLTGLEPTFFGHVVDGWRLTFLINVPIGLAAALAAPRLLAESESHPGELDLPGALSGTLGLVGIVYGLTRAGDPATAGATPGPWPRSVAGVLLLAAFVVIERSVEHPLLPFRILANRTRATSFVVMMLVPAAMFAMFYFLSQFVQNVMGFSPLQDRLRVPAVQRRHRDRRGHGLLQADREGRPALARRRRHGDGRRRAVRLLAAALRRLARRPRRSTRTTPPTSCRSSS